MVMEAAQSNVGGDRITLSETKDVRDPPPSQDWRALPIGSFAPLQRGFDLPSSRLKNGKFPVAYSNGVLNWHSEFMVKGPGVVTGRSGTLGKVTYVEQDFWPHNTALWVTDFNGHHPKFVYYLFTHIGFSRFASGSGVPTLNRNDAHAFVVSVPSNIEEQRAIAQALDNASEYIASIESAIGKKRLVKQGAMQELLSGRRRLPQFSGEWIEARLGARGTFFKGSGVRRDQSQSGALPCVRYGELYTHFEDVIRSFFSRISTGVAVSAQKVVRGDILFAGSGETKAEIGKCAVLDGAEYAYAGGDIIVFRPRNDDPVFLAYYLNSPPVQAQKAAKGQGDAVVHISARALSDLELNLPSREEQEAIAAALIEMDSELQALEARLEKARQIKQGMMQELLTGRVRLV